MPAKLTTRQLVAHWPAAKTDRCGKAIVAIAMTDGPVSTATFARRIVPATLLWKLATVVFAIRMARLLSKTTRCVMSRTRRSCLCSRAKSPKLPSTARGNPASVTFNVRALPCFPLFSASVPLVFNPSSPPKAHRTPSSSRL